MQDSIKSVALATQFYWFLGVHAEESEHGEAYHRWQEELLTLTLTLIGGLS